MLAPGGLTTKLLASRLITVVDGGRRLPPSLAGASSTPWLPKREHQKLAPGAGPLFGPRCQLLLTGFDVPPFGGVTYNPGFPKEFGRCMCGIKIKRKSKLSYQLFLVAELVDRIPDPGLSTTQDTLFPPARIRQRWRTLQTGFA